MASGKRPPSAASPNRPHSHGGGGDGITGGRAAGSGSGRLNRSDQIARRDPYPLLPGHGFGFKKEKSADCHDGCVPKEVHERLLECLLEIEDFMADLRDSCERNVSCTSALNLPARTLVLMKTFRSELVLKDRSIGEQHELLYGSALSLSYHWGCKSGGGREPAGRFSYASASSYAGPMADFRAPPVPPSLAPRARDIRKRSRSPTRGALPPKDNGGDLQMKRGRDDRHGPV